MKRFLLGCLIAVCLTGMLLGFPGQSAEAAETLRNKIVYLLMDNSGSMWNKKTTSLRTSRWNSAIYALESFASLLNTDDALAVNSINRHSAKDKIQYKEQKLTASNLKTLLKMSEGKDNELQGATPFKGVKDLYGDLRGAYQNKTISADTELWFVVVTDGEFDNGETGKNREVVSREEVYQFFEEVANTPIGNVYPQVLYLPIIEGDDSYVLGKLNRNPRIKEYVSDLTGTTGNKSEIIKTMDQISDQISGRVRYEKGQYTIDGSSIRINADIPMRDMIVMIQGNNEYPNISVNGLVPGDRNETIVSPGKNLKAFVRQFKMKNGANIRGDVVIDLGKAPSQEDTITILFQPALELQNTYTVFDPSGNKREEYVQQEFQNARIYQNDTIRVNVAVVESGTGKRYSIQDLNGICSVRDLDGEVSGGPESYTYTARGDNVLTTEVELTRHGHQKLRSEVTFTVNKGNRPTVPPTPTPSPTPSPSPTPTVVVWAGADGKAASETSVSVTQLDLIRKGITVSFKTSSSLDKSLEDYYKSKELKAVSGFDSKQVQMDIASGSGKNTIAFTLKAQKNAVPKAGDYQVQVTLFKKTVSRTVQVKGSILSLAVSDTDPKDNRIEVSLLELEKNSIQRPVVLFDNGKRVADIGGLEVDVSGVPGATFEDGKLTIRYSEKLRPGTYSVQAKPFLGIPVKGIEIHVTDGTEQALESGKIGAEPNSRVGNEKINTEVTQLEMLENGGTLVFPVSIDGGAVHQKYIESWIGNNLFDVKVTPSTGGTVKPELKALEGGVQIRLPSGKWIDAKSAAQPWKVELSLSKKSLGSGSVTVKPSSFRLDTDRSSVDYNDFRNGDAKLTVTKVTGDTQKGQGRVYSSKEEWKKLGIEIGNDLSAGTWDKEQFSFSLRPRDNFREPVILPFRVMGEEKGNITITVEDPTTGLKTVSDAEEETEGKEADVRKTQLQFWQDRNNEMHFMITDADGSGISQAKAKDILGSLADRLNIDTGVFRFGELKPENGGYGFTVSVPEAAGYWDIPTGRYSFSMKDDQGKTYAVTTLEITKSDIRTERISAPVSWKNFKDAGNYMLKLSVKDGERILPADQADLKIRIGEDEGAEWISPASVSAESAEFALPFSNLPNGQVLRISTKAYQAELNPIELAFAKAEYTMKIEPETSGPVSQMDLLETGVSFTATLLEDGEPINAQEIQVICPEDCFTDTEEADGNIKRITIKGNDLAIPAGEYGITFRSNRAGDQTVSLTVSDSDFRVNSEGETERAIQPEELVSKDGYPIRFRVTDGQGRSVPKEQILKVVETPDFTDTGEKLTWEPEDGALTCTVTTEQSLADYVGEDRHFTVSVKQRDGAEAEVSVTVKKLYYVIENEASDSQETIRVHMEDKDRAYTWFRVYYADEEGNRKETVPTEELQRWIEKKDIFETTVTYEPKCLLQKILYHIGSRMVARLEATDEAGKIKAYAESAFGYDGLWGLEGLWHNAGNRWFTPVGEATMNLKIRGSEHESRATFSIIPGNTLEEALYFWIPIYLIGLIIRWLFMRQLPGRALGVGTLLRNGNERDREFIIENNGNGENYQEIHLFCRKILGVVLWPFALIHSILNGITGRGLYNFGSEKRIRLGNERDIVAIIRGENRLLVFGKQRTFYIYIDAGKEPYQAIIIIKKIINTEVHASGIYTRTDGSYSQEIVKKPELEGEEELSCLVAAKRKNDETFDFIIYPAL